MVLVIPNCGNKVCPWNRDCDGRQPGSLNGFILSHSVSLSLRKALVPGMAKK